MMSRCYQQIMTTDQGTGLVHIAPGHGAEDYILRLLICSSARTISAEGRIMDHLPISAGMSSPVTCHWLFC